MMRSKLAATIAILADVNAFAQSNQGTITGTISDPAGAVIAGAALEVRNTATGVLFRGGSSGTADGNIGNWPKVIDGALKLDVDRVLPGHGAPGGREVLMGQRAFFVELHKAVVAAIKSGKKLTDLVKTDQGRQGASLQLPDTVKTWVGGSLAAQVTDTYNEITQKRPAGDLPH